MKEEELKNAVSKIMWWHKINLGNGIITPGIDNSPSKLEFIKMPENLQGTTVLDIGAWDGFFSFEAERRGAERVLATDSVCWSGTGRASKAGFDFAKKTLNSNIEDMKIGVLEISPEIIGTFDLVLFLGVLYHMRFPLLALEKVFSVTRDLLILETHIDLIEFKRPVMAFYPHDELGNDASNWWGPNPVAVEDMLEVVGFKKIKMVSQKDGRAVFHARR